MKNRTPLQSKNTMFNYLNKSPQVASGHQPQQEASNGFSAEVGENPAKHKLFSDPPEIIDVCDDEKINIGPSVKIVL